MEDENDPGEQIKLTLIEISMVELLKKGDQMTVRMRRGRSRRTSRIGIMRTLVAVFEIHMERSMVGIMKPSMIIRGEVPKRLSTDIAILLMGCWAYSREVGFSNA